MNLKKQFGYPAKRGPLSAGFTLIELLVVVLIIGILSAVALPQYQKAVARSRMAELFGMVNTFDKAHAIYALENPYSGPSTPIPSIETLLAAGGYELGGGEWENTSTYKTKNYRYTFGPTSVPASNSIVVSISIYTPDFSLWLPTPTTIKGIGGTCRGSTSVGNYICSEIMRQYPNLSWNAS